MEWKERISKAVKGTKHLPRTKEHCNKLRNARLGCKMSLEARQKISKANQGEKNTFWRGGVNREYPQEWGNVLRESIRNRDGNQCQICGVPQIECCRKLDVHHIDEDKKNINPQNLITVCRKCHLKGRFNVQYWKEKFQYLIESKVV